MNQATCRFAMAFASLLLVSLTLLVKGASSEEKPTVASAANNTAGQTLSPHGVYNVRKATLNWLEKPSAKGNARLDVEFLEKRGPVVSVAFDDQTIVLRDDGHGQYSGLLRIDGEDLQAFKEASAATGATAVFDGRRRIAQDRPLRTLSAARGETVDLLAPYGCPASVDPARELMITSPGVVKDTSRTYDPITDTGNGQGVWSFGHVMTVLADTPRSHISPEAFTRRWLGRWEHEQVVNDFTVQNRAAGIQTIINPWPKTSSGELNLAKAPFRLLAIVNRVDLRDHDLFETPPAALTALSATIVPHQPQVPRASPGGEARLVFGAVNLTTKQPLPFTVIFEFGVFMDSCKEVRHWAREWHRLQQHSLASPAYNAALARLTDRFVQPALDPAQPRRPFGLNQVRTNEIALALAEGDNPPLWELREFHVEHEGAAAGHLEEVTVGQTPNNAAPDGSPEDLNLRQVIADYVNANETLLLTNTHSVPLQFPSGQPFLGARSLTKTNQFFWNANPGASPPIHSNEARHHFSLNTCNGCHGGETATPRFVMVSPTDENPDHSAMLAPFLTGVTVTDPVDHVTQRPFNDLDRRKRDLEQLICLPCIFELFHRPVRMTH